MKQKDLAHAFFASTKPYRKTASERCDELREQIRQHDRNYHEQDNPKITDAQYDALALALEEIARDGPELVTDDSPSK